MKTIANIVYAFFVAALVGIALTLLGTLLPIPGGYEVKIVQSGSMEPAIKTGSVVVIKPYDTYVVGEVITFGEDTREKIPTTHRIIADTVIEGEVYYTVQGDANEEPDAEPVLKADVIGKVILNVPYMGFVIDFARQPLGFILLIVVPASLVILDELWNIGTEVRAMFRRRSTSVSEKPHAKL
jgi:signal peptidase